MTSNPRIRAGLKESPRVKRGSKMKTVQGGIVGVVSKLCRWICAEGNRLNGFSFSLKREIVNALVK